ncbi:MAG: acetylxylan esterase [Planctomycetota bacterium]|nr:acetylxylan esterase [Planctomycetota bacterium]
MTTTTPLQSTLTLLLLLVIHTGAPAEAAPGGVADELRNLDSRVLTHEQAQPKLAPDDLRSMLSRDIRARRQSVNERDLTAWRTISDRDQWERHRDAKIAVLTQSLGTFTDPPDDLQVQVTRSLPGDGFVIDCLVFESRAGLLVTANLYRPATPRESMPGILICHSHHNPKTEGELQDMGMMWARAGCLVLIMDQVGHGERRQHPFKTAADYDGEFRASRQDYYFRYNVGIQLHLIGDSLIGWMAWDLMRGVDLLLDQPGIDPERIILLGSVAGGGDPAAVTAAIDDRIKAVVPFNFGGPQPETVFPLPDDAELSFNYVGGGSWESTRNLRLSARDGFLPWTIVAATAPRALIYAHEFKWDSDNDPVWKRLESIFGMYDCRDRLSSLKGYGAVQLSSNEASHCNNIGGQHRAQIHPAFERWFNIVVSDPDFRDRRDSSALLCVEGVETDTPIALPRVHELAGAIADQRLRSFREQLDSNPTDRTAVLRTAWSEVLGGVAHSQVADAKTTTDEQEQFRLVRFTLNPERDILVPGILLLPKNPAHQHCPAVVAIAQSGKQRFLAERHASIARLLEAGIAVCLPDLRGTGETRPGDYRGRSSNATGLSSSKLMLGGTLLGSRLSDLLTVVHWLRTRPDIDDASIAVWGDSFANVNGPDHRIDVPLGIDDEPTHSEPLGATLALLAGLFDDDMKAVVARGGLVSVRSVLDSPFMHVPHDFVVPGLLTAGDLPDIAAAIAPRPLRVEGLVDGTNRRAESLREWQTTSAAYAQSPENLVVEIDASQPSIVVDWLIRKTFDD